MPFRFGLLLLLLVVVVEVLGDAQKEEVENTPVVILRTGGEFAMSNLFATRICVQCRPDQRQKCRSTTLSCIQDPSGNTWVQEELWTDGYNCEGEANSTLLFPSTDIETLKKGGQEGLFCPPSSFYSPKELDLSRFVPNLMRDYSHKFSSEDQIKQSIVEYQKMLILAQRFPQNPIVPSPLVDLIWHAHILDTVAYMRDCLRLFGRYIHHSPSFGGEDEKKELVSKYTHMMTRYRSVFKEDPPEEIWIEKSTTKRGKPPGAGPPSNYGSFDCCAAECVKPKCAGCVGCDLVYCGHTIPTGYTEPDTLLSPDQYSGYSPVTPSEGAEMEEVMGGATSESSGDEEEPLVWTHPVSPSSEYPPELFTRISFYNYSVTPTSGLTVSWSAVNGILYAKFQFKGAKTWVGMGIAANSLCQMSYADYNIAMFNHNWTGVFDLYRPVSGMGYPCWDNIVECGGPIGRSDTVTISLERQASGFSTLTTVEWSRRMDTGDPKDHPISATGKTYLLFAYGSDDWFTLHKNHVAGWIDFVHGQATWPVTRGG